MNVKINFIFAIALELPSEDSEDHSGYFHIETGYFNLLFCMNIQKLILYFPF
jgi:hypothetical protein